jgi:copper homeostasis protein
LFRAFEEVSSAGVDRLLTSGGQPTATLGQEAIAQVIKQARGRIVIMPGSGVKPENAQSLVAATGAREIHASLRTSLPSPMRYQNPRIAMGSGDPDGREYARFIVREDDVRRLCQAVNPAENRIS